MTIGREDYHNRKIAKIDHLQKAIELLEAKLSKLENRQADMKAANAHYRKHKTMRGFLPLSDEYADKLDKTIKDTYEQCPHPNYELQNNNATIRATKQRIVQFKVIDIMPDKEIPFDNGKIQINNEQNRVQIHFTEQPNNDMIAKLKRQGFKWSSNNQCWQRLRNLNAFSGVKQICGII